MTPDRPRVSVVISTLNRARELERALESLRWVSYEPGFEVIVVTGPSTDDTKLVVGRWGDAIKRVHCDVANLSVSRNNGIAQAAGEIVAFVDDDAVVEAEWLDELVTVYDDDDVVAAGGFVFDHTGVAYQHTYLLVDRFGLPHVVDAANLDRYAFPGSWRTPHLLGTNASARADAVRAVGGFDEEYEYFLDESDLLVRLVDHGGVIRQVDGAHVHHKFAPSAIRGLTRVARDRFSVIKNHAYFGLRHAVQHLDASAIEAERKQFFARQLDELVDAASLGLVDSSDVDAFRAYAPRADEQARAAAARPAKTRPVWPEPRPFARFPVLDGSRVHRVVMARGSMDAGRFARARAIARAGQIPHLIRPTAEPYNVDFAAGVWIHSVPHDRGRRGLDDERQRVMSRFATSE